MQTLEQTLYTVSTVLLCSLLILPSSTANHDECLSNPDGTPVVCAVCSDRQAGVKWNVSSVANINRIVIYKYSCTNTTGHKISINNSCHRTRHDELGVANTFGGLYQHGYSGPASRIHVIDADLDAGVECTFSVYYTLKSSSKLNYLTPSCTIKNSTECERDPDSCLLPATCVNNNGECQCQCSEGYQPGEETPNCTGTDQCGNGLICSVSPPAITSQPQDRLNVIPEAGNVTFAISASGVHLSYSWQHNGHALSADDGKYEGTDTPILTIFNIQETDEGLYLCIVTNQNGSVTSNSAILMLISPPEIVLSPQSMEVENGVIVELSCSAVGGGILQFTWNTTANETLPAPFTKDMNSTLTFNMTPIHMGDYQCTVTNERGSSVSETATINISVTAHSSNKVKFGATVTTFCALVGVAIITAIALVAIGIVKCKRITMERQALKYWRDLGFGFTDRIDPYFVPVELDVQTLASEPMSSIFDSLGDVFERASDNLSQNSTSAVEPRKISTKQSPDDVNGENDPKTSGENAKDCCHDNQIGEEEQASVSHEPSSNYDCSGAGYVECVENPKAIVEPHKAEYILMTTTPPCDCAIEVPLNDSGIGGELFGSDTDKTRGEDNNSSGYISDGDLPFMDTDYDDTDKVNTFPTSVGYV